MYLNFSTKHIPANFSSNTCRDSPHLTGATPVLAMTVSCWALIEAKTTNLGETEGFLSKRDCGLLNIVGISGTNNLD